MSVTTKHNSVEITYDEGADKWKFTLRGRDRVVDTLLKAKEYIDKPVKGANAFVKFAAFVLRDYRFEGTKSRGRVHPVTVTGVHSHKTYDKRLQVWVQDATGRRIEAVDAVFADNDKNRDTAVKIEEAHLAEYTARRIREALEKSLETIKVSEEE